MGKEKKIGAGIITMSILIFVGSAFAIFGGIINLAMGDSINQIMLEGGTIDQSMLPTKTDYIISLVTSILSVIFVILILMKKKVGVFAYFGLYILSSVYGLISNGITSLGLVSIGINLAFLALYGFFIYKKRELYGFIEEETIEANN